jgi:hypothetical protein
VLHKSVNNWIEQLLYEVAGLRHDVKPQQLERRVLLTETSEVGRVVVFGFLTFRFLKRVIFDGYLLLSLPFLCGSGRLARKSPGW